MSITQKCTHLQRTQDMLIPTLSSSCPQFDQTISNQTSIQPQQEIYSNLSANEYVPQSNNKFKHTKIQEKMSQLLNILHTFQIKIIYNNITL